MKMDLEMEINPIPKTEINQQTGRKAISWFLIGDLNSGKTYFLQNKIINRVAMDKKVVVFDSTGQDTYNVYQKVYAHQLTSLNGVNRGVYVVKSNQLNNKKQRKEIIESLFNHLHNSWLIIEDSTFFIKGKVDEELLGMVTQLRHRDIDIIIVGHILSSLPDNLVGLFDRIILFNVSENLDYDFKYKYKSYPSVLFGFVWINTLPMPKYSYLQILHKEHRILYDKKEYRIKPNISYDKLFK